MQTQTLTIPISTKLNIWLNQEAQQLKKTKKEIVETALFELQKKIIGQKIKSSYAQSKNDPEMKELAEAGLQDYLKFI